MLAEVDSAALAATRAFNAELEELQAKLTPAETLPPDFTRAERRAGRGIFPPPEFLPQARNVAIPTRGGEINLRLLAPDDAATGVYLHLHGGGWVLGAADLEDRDLRALVEATGLCAVSIDYRLAPEHPYPAGPDDCEDAALWLLEKGAHHLDAPNALTIGGESAGAHLAAATLLRLRDRHGITNAFRGANLVFGCYDLSMTPSQRLWKRSLVLSPTFMRWAADCFVPDLTREERRDPDISPLYADLRDLPPALFTVGTLDPLLDDSLFMAARWRQAGNDAHLRVYAEAVHGFTAFPIGVAQQCLADQYAFLRAAVA